MSGGLTSDEVNKGFQLFNEIVRDKFKFAFAGVVAMKIWNNNGSWITHFEIIVPKGPAWESNLKTFTTQNSNTDQFRNGEIIPIATSDHI